MHLINKILFFGGSADSLTKSAMFTRIVIWMVILGIVISGATRITFITDDDSDSLKIAVIGPMSGENAAIGRSMAQGVRLLVDTVSKDGGFGGEKLSVLIIDDKNDPDLARQAVEQAAANQTVVAAVGHWTDRALQGAQAIYAENGLPLITPSASSGEVITENEWLFTSVFSAEREARFLANYSRNVLGNKLASIIYDRAGKTAIMAEEYEKTYRRFGTAIRHKWSFDSTDPNVNEQIDELVKELKERKDAGVLFIAAPEQQSAKLIKDIREERIRNAIIAPNALATDAFLETLGGLVTDGTDPDRFTNEILVSAPLLFDTANETAQNLRNGYLAAFKMQPDWVAAFAYDSANLAVAGLRAVIRDKDDVEDSMAVRRGIKDYLLSRNSVDTAIPGISGETFFDEGGRAQKPVLVGIYNGRNIISALTQLQPIKPGAGGNLIKELREGRVLYVNDRFMYKTNVVYTGLQVKEVSELDLEKNVFTMEFLIWFRYRGNFEPQDVSFANAAEPIRLETPLEEKIVDGLQYRIYQVKGKFNFNFTNTNRQFSSHVVGVSLAHNRLNQNNLRYVVDVLGIGLDKGETVLDKVNRAQAINQGSGWLTDRAWISSDIDARGALGDPVYVGFGNASPDFSKVDYGILIKPARFNARDFLTTELFIYIGIFGLLGIVFAILMDRKEKGRFWAVQSWFLRLVTWPMALLAAGNLSLELAFQNLPEHVIVQIVLFYDLLWWFVPARLIGIAAERFVWQPLEDHTERNIPNVIRVFGSVVVYSFAGFGVVAFVFDQQLTSLLASTGLLAMIVGLAIQANISNIFSGIVINLERPFHVGDWIQIGDMDEGKVVDITWRTTRVKTRGGYVISIPNGQVSEAQIHNFDSFDSIRLELPVFLDADVPPDQAQEIMFEGLNEMEELLEDPPREVRFRGIQWNFAWIAEYEIQFWIDNYGHKDSIQEAVMEHVYGALRRNGLSPAGAVPGTGEDLTDTPVEKIGKPAAE